ncbi:alpha/beta hydrolase [Litorisediminicola beolgyonensis]|uniref:Alpha/beta hydrolase n=1 Tax=Litorisediminicola beolgyonensis TaxID=1173614 RepID=A0ABW3ZKT6_9RHOB
MRPRRVFDGVRLRGDLFNADAPKLFVSFRQRLERPGAFDEARPVKSFTDRGHAHLALQARENDWYINDETPAFEVMLAEVATRYKRVVSMGFSMGGYAALRFSKALDLKRVIAISPQVSISPALVPGDIRFHRFAAEFDPERGDLASHGRLRLRGAVLFDPFRPLDAFNAEAIGAIFSNLALCRLAGGGHPATRTLREGGGYPALQRLLVGNEVARADITGLHRAGRAKSPNYWHNLSGIATRRGRPTLAEEAARRRAALGGHDADPGLDDGASSP